VYSVFSSCKLPDVFVPVPKIGISRHIFIKVFNFGFFENSFSWRRADIFGQTERERVRKKIRQKDRHGEDKRRFS